MVAHAFDPNSQKAEYRDFCEFEASQTYIASSSTAKTTERDPDKKKRRHREREGGEGQSYWSHC